MANVALDIAFGSACFCDINCEKSGSISKNISLFQLLFFSNVDWSKTHCHGIIREELD